jgi:carbohydrate-binding DOMON domain-containing protein
MHTYIHTRKQISTHTYTHTHTHTHTHIHTYTNTSVAVSSDKLSFAKGALLSAPYKDEGYYDAKVLSSPSASKVRKHRNL